jgi:hypothetical protein
MDWASVLYLGITFGMVVIFGLIVWRTYSRKNKSRLEEPKNRMLDDD